MIKVSKHKVRQAADTRPPEYESQLAAAAQREDELYYYFSSQVYAELFEKYRGQQYQPASVEQVGVTPWQERLVTLVSKLRTPEDRGVGDTVERLLAKVGGRKIKHLLRLANLPCRCDDRQKWLNERFPYLKPSDDSPEYSAGSSLTSKILLSAMVRYQGWSWDSLL